MVERLLKEQLVTLHQLRDLLKEETLLLKKGTASEILGLIDRKQVLTCQLADLEAKRASYMKETSLASFLVQYPELNPLQEMYRSVCQDIRILNELNEGLTLLAKDFSKEKFVLYSNLTQKQSGTYGRNGSYSSTQYVGSTIVSRDV